MNALAHMPSDIIRRRTLNIKEAATFCGLSVPTFRRLRSRSALPEPLRLSERRIGWRIGDLMDWQDCREAAREWKDCKGAA